MRDDTSLFIGSDNVFADLGLPNPDGLLAKAKLTAQLQSFLDQHDLTDTQAATRLGISQAQVTRLLDGHLDDFTFDQIFHYLNRLGLGIEVRVLAPRQKPEDATLTVTAA